MKYMNRQIKGTEIETVVKKAQQPEVKDQLALQANSIKHLEKS